MLGNRLALAALAAVALITLLAAAPAGAEDLQSELERRRSATTATGSNS
jgi:hypothetical protein